MQNQLADRLCPATATSDSPRRLETIATAGIRARASMTDEEGEEAGEKTGEEGENEIAESLTAQEAAEAAEEGASMSGNKETAMGRSEAATT